MNIFIWGFSMSWIFRYPLSVVEKKYLQGFDAFGWTPFNDLAAGDVGMGYKTGPTTPSQIGEVRFSETKGAHKS